MRVIFMGTPDFAVPTFKRIIEHGHKIVACYTKPPRAAGRGQREKKSPVHLAAEAAGVPVFTPKSLKNQEQQELFASHGADIGVVVAYGLILPKAVLDAPVHGCLNLHGSRLPRWRGAAPIQRAIMAGDKSTAVQVMQMDEGLDTGAVGLSTEITIDAQMSAGELHNRMMELGADLMVKALDMLERGELRFTPQNEQGATYARKIDKAEARINWNLPAQQVHDLIRALFPFPGAWCKMELKGAPVRVKILRSMVAQGQGTPGQILDDRLLIACAEGAIQALKVQRQGKGVMEVADFLRGTGSLQGQVLTSAQTKDGQDDAQI